MAVNLGTGNVYVADAGNNRVNVFDEDGAFLFSFGTSGSGAGQFSNPRRVAVDNNATSPNFQDVYVADNSQRIQRFSAVGVYESATAAAQINRSNPPIAVGVAGDLYVVDGTAVENQVKVFQPGSATSTVISALSVSDLPGGLAVDSAGNVFVSYQSIAPVQKYEPTEPAATLLESFDAGANTSAMTIDGSGNLFAAQLDSGLRRVITMRDSSGSIVKRFGYGEIQFNLQGLAIGVTGDLFGSESSENRVFRIPQPPAGPLPCCVTVDPGNTKATLKAQVNPEGKATTYHFEYLTDADFVANGNSFSGPSPATKTPENTPVGPDFVLHDAQAQIGCATPTDPPQPECLEPKTKYHVRLVATNEDDENSSPEVAFVSRPSFDIDKGTWSTDVGLNDAEIHAQINPLGIPATAFFEYVDDAGFQASGFANAVKAPATPIDLGGGEAGVVASTRLSGLTPNRLYHYRVVVANSFVADGEAGPARTFLTYPPRPPIPPCANDAFRVAVAALLANCRAYEMVSPIDKNGGDIKVLVQTVGFPARLDQSADSGDAFTYSAIAPFAEPQSSLWANQYLAQRGPAGWSNEPINQPKEPTNLVENPGLKLDVQYRLFNSDLSNGWVSQYANPQAGECAPQGFINLYRRDNATGAYEALLPNPPTNIASNPDYRIELQGVSADGTKAVFRANAKLSPEASGVSGTNAYQLYMHIRDPEGGCGEVRLVGFKTTGAPFTEPASAGTPAGPAEYRQSTVSRAVSANGSRVFFTVGSISTGTGSFFARVNADQPQSPVSGGKCTVPELGCTLEISAAARFWTANTAGSRVIYSVGTELFEYDVDKALANEAAKTTIAAGAQGVVGASDDASRVYFVSTEAIEGEGEGGKPNLYLYEAAKAAAEKYRLVATLSELDLQGLDLYGLSVARSAPISNGTRVSADGSHLAFVSQKSLTGYDNIDANTGEPAIEVYLYDTAGEAVRCVSCNPSGSRPKGRQLKAGTTVRRVAAMMAPGESQTFAPRSLSADGSHLFFESFESLLPRDENEAEDVYEWQRADNQEACEEAGAELYVPSAAGCLSLISSGEPGATDSELADASPDGADAFIRTASSLVPQDPGQVDVYDVREGGGFPPAVREEACVGEACAGSVPPTPSVTEIASQGQSAGNPVPAKPCPKGKVRKSGKCKPKPKPKPHKKKKAAKGKKGGRK